MARRVQTPAPMTMRNTVMALPLLLLAACRAGVDDAPATEGEKGAGTDSAPSSGGCSGSTSSGLSVRGCGQPPIRPRCDLHDVEYATKKEACIDDANVSCYERVSDGRTVWCTNYDEDECRGVHQCPVGSAEVSACGERFPCETQTICGHAIFCQRFDPQCDEPLPDCQPNDQRIGGSSQCLYDQGCYSNQNACGRSVWCRARRTF